MTTFSAKASEIPHKWWVIDASDQVLGRVAVKAANLLRGKEKTVFTPHVDTGDFVIVINAEKVRLTGKKEEQKSYMSFSGYVGGHKSENVRARRARHPELLIERAVRGMIPHNRLGRRVYRKLKVYRGNSHPHAAQQPEAAQAVAGARAARARQSRHRPRRRHPRSATRSQWAVAPESLMPTHAVALARWRPVRRSPRRWGAT